jgi:VanZ family protein
MAILFFYSEEPRSGFKLNSSLELISNNERKTVPAFSFYLLFCSTEMRYATILVSLLIVTAILIPGSNLPDVNIGSYDKLIHMVMFTVWALAVRYDFDNTRPVRYLMIFVAGLLFSLLTEVLQILIEGRTFDTYDMAADAVGVIVGLLISAPVLRWVKRFK